jgi:hypothetical protein
MLRIELNEGILNIIRHTFGDEEVRKLEKLSKEELIQFIITTQTIGCLNDAEEKYKEMYGNNEDEEEQEEEQEDTFEDYKRRRNYMFG